MIAIFIDRFRRSFGVALLALILVSLFPKPVSAADEPVDVSIIMSTKQCMMLTKVVKDIYADYPWLEEKANLRVFPLDADDVEELPGLIRSKLIFVFIHNPGPLERFMPVIIPALDNGVKVYAMGSSPDEQAYREKGILFNKKVLAYFSASGEQNYRNMILSRLREDLNMAVSFNEPYEHAEHGIYERASNELYKDFEIYKQNYGSYNESSPWIGFIFWRSSVISGQTAVIDEVIESIEKRGYNVLPVFGFPEAKTMEMFFMDEAGEARVEMVVAQSLWHGVRPDEMSVLLDLLGVPVINTIQLSGSEKEWRDSPEGISVWQRTTTLAIPELMGLVQPIVIGSSEKITDPRTGVEYAVLKPIHDRIQRLAERVNAWYMLRAKANADKNVALIYYSYPPGKENIGASYLNVLPQTLVQMLNRLKDDGYDLDGRAIDPDTIYNEVIGWGRLLGNYAQGEMEKLVATGKPVMIPINEYKEWFNRLTPKLQREIIDSWGSVDDTDIMVWHDSKGKGYLVIPVVRYGNVILTTQPARGWGEDADKMYHDVTLAPPHQYVAFYLYMQKSFRADAVVHIGTHGTYEWLSGKQAGLSDDDPSEALIGSIPSIYPYIVDDVGEGLQAKRRGVAVMIDHMTPPFDEAGLNPDLRELKDLISEHNAAHGKSATLAVAKIDEINKIAKETGLLKDMEIDSVATHDQIHDLEHYLKEIAEKQSPFGLHTFGLSPENEYIEKTARAMAEIDKKLSDSDRKKLIEEYKERIAASGPAELDAFSAALNGEYISAKKGGDPLRNPNSLPTGKNFYAFDPSRIPSKAVYALGRKLGDELLKSYKQENGQYPDKLSFNLWSTECIRHEGVQEAQIMYLLGIKPKWNARGKVTGVEAIPRHVLGRPRVDVIMVPSGLYRDIFSNLMELMDQSVEIARDQDEQDNFVRRHIMATRGELIKKGVDSDLASRLASVRMFSVPTGAYGTGIENIVEASGTWEEENEVISVYFNRMSHLYGQGFHGVKAEENLDELKGLKGFSIDLFKQALSGTDAAVHSRSTNVYASLDNDDFYQYLGATAMAVRSVDGNTPKVYVTNLSNPNDAKQESLEKFMGREMRSRYLNPKWINEMMDEGYSGARFVKRVVNHLWGWQVTVPDAVGDEKWQEVYETYVEDKFELDIEQKFRDADNLWAYQNILARMLEVVRKDYWDADEEVVATMLEEYIDTIDEVGLACSGNICDNPKLVDYVAGQMEQIPELASRVDDYLEALDQVHNASMELASLPDPARQVAQETAVKNASYQPKRNIEGYEMEEVSQDIQGSPVKPLSGSLIFLLASFVVGWIFLSKRKK